MGLFERYLSLWIALAIVAGVLLGWLIPAAATTIAALQVSGINLLIALLIWGMIFPMMLAVDFSAIGSIGSQPRALLVTVAVQIFMHLRLPTQLQVSCMCLPPTTAAGSVLFLVKKRMPASINRLALHSLLMQMVRVADLRVWHRIFPTLNRLIAP